MRGPLRRAGLYLNTLRHLKPVQFYNRAWRRFHSPALRVAGLAAQREARHTWIEAVPAPATLISPDEFEFLGERHRIDTSGDWNNADWPRLWRYHLHYFDDLNAVGAGERRSWHLALMRRWCAENPPGSTPGWEPYPTSLRIINWIRFWLANPECCDPPLVQSLQLQAAFLYPRIELHLLGNHVLENARALLFAGTFFTGPDAQRWRERGKRVLREQLCEQVLEDGGHFERSPMYHLKVLLGLLDTINLLRTFGLECPPWLLEPVVRMLTWASWMRHPDGQIPLFQDSYLDAPSSAECCMEYAARLDLPLPADPAPLVFGPQSGYARASLGPWTAICDVGGVSPDYQPGHAHAGTLTFELSVDAIRAIVDTGVSTYEAGDRRDWERGTAAHNTVKVDGEDSSEVWGAFRVARRARVTGVVCEHDVGGVQVRASHDGYRYLNRPVTHERTFRIKPTQCRVEDRLLGRGSHLAQLGLNFHPSWHLQGTGATWEAAHLNGRRLRIRLPEHADVEILPFDYAARFGHLERGQRLRVCIRCVLPMVVTTCIELA